MRSQSLEVDLWLDENQNGLLEVELLSERFHGRLTLESAGSFVGTAHTRGPLPIG